MSSALYEFMPYGAPEMIETASPRMFRATVSGTTLWILAFVALLGWMLYRPKVEEPVRTVVISYRELAAPPPLTQDAPPPAIVLARPKASPVAGIPVPVPDTEAPVDQVIASQEEISAATGSVEGDGEATIVVQPTAVEELPKLGEFVYSDELPVLITDTPPRYPTLAREAGLEGEVLLRVLVGKDGRVKEVHVDQSIPMLDPAAIEAARTWVFKPALTNNRPVAVWIARRVRFTLTSS
jgi:periplasmic protein TonB